MSKMINGEELLKRIDDIAKGPFINETSLLNDVRLAIIGEMQSPEPQPIMIDSEELIKAFDNHWRTNNDMIHQSSYDTGIRWCIEYVKERRSVIKGESKC